MTPLHPMTEAARRHLAAFTLIGLALFAPLVWMYFRPVEGLFDVAGYPLGRDFINIWMGSRLAERSVMTLFDYKAYYLAIQDAFGAQTPFHNWSYPPSFLFLVQPFGWLPYVPGLVVWTVLGFALYAATVLRRVAPSARGIALALLALAPATLVNIVTGQNGLFSAALLLGGIVALERRPVLAGVLFGLLTVKPHLGVLLPVALVMIRAWRTILAAAITAAVLVAASLVQWGLAPWIGWFTATAAITRFHLASFEGFYTYMMPCVYGSARLLGASIGWALVVQGLVSLVVVVATALVFGRAKDAPLRALLVTLGTLLASPYTFNYDLAALTGAMLWVVAAMPAFGPRERTLFGLAWVAPVLVWPLHLLGIAVVPLILAGVFALAVNWILWPDSNVAEHHDQSDRLELAKHVRTA